MAATSSPASVESASISSRPTLTATLCDQDLRRRGRGFEVPLNELLERLTMNGLEIEALTDLGAESGKVVVGQILEMGPHPNAENLVLAQVNTGGPEPLRIVCGAKNMKPGDYVPVAIEGAKLPNGLTIKKSKIRGEASMGMMCSGDELGWNEDHAGLLILPPEQDFYKLGHAIRSADRHQGDPEPSGLPVGLRHRAGCGRGVWQTCTGIPTRRSEGERRAEQRSRPRYAWMRWMTVRATWAA